MKIHYALMLLMIGNVISSVAYSQEQHYIGPVGLFGAVSSKEIKVTKVEAGSPADGKIKEGDVLIGAQGMEFKTHVRREMADAIDSAETKDGDGELALMLKDGRKVDVKLEVLGSYSDTFPYNCPKTEAILKRMAPYLDKPNQCRFGLPFLAKMAIGGKEAAEKIGPGAWRGGGGNRLYCTWDWGYQGIGMAEYYLLTGDKTILPALEGLVLSLARGQDAGGLWGHQLATAERLWRLPGYAQMNQPSLSCLLAMQLAKKCGIKHPDLDRGIERTEAFYATYVDRGTLPYGVHSPNIKTFNNNGMSATAAFAMDLSGNKHGVEFFSQLCAMSYDGLETGHACHAFNTMWTPLGVSLAGPETTTRFFREARWLYTLYRSWDGHMTWNGGSGDSPEFAAGMILPLSLGLRNLYITGRESDKSLWLKGDNVTKIFNISKVDYQNSTADALIALFGMPFPQVTGPAISSLQSKENSGGFIPKIVDMMKNGTITEKVSAVGYFGYGCNKETAIAHLDDLGAILRDSKENINVRVAASGALSQLGEPAYPYYQDIVQLVAQDRPDDRFGDVEQTLGLHMNALCKNPFASGLVKDKDAFYKTALKLANHKRQHARAEGLKMLAGMPLEDFYRVADTVVHVIDDKDPSYHSYHSPGGPVSSAITVLANLNIAEGIQYALEIPNKPYGKHMFKIVACWTALTPYKGNAKAALDQMRLKEEAVGRHAAAYNALVKAVDEDKNPAKLITLKEAIEVGLKAKNDADNKK